MRAPYVKFNSLTSLSPKKSLIAIPVLVTVGCWKKKERKRINTFVSLTKKEKKKRTFPLNWFTEVNSTHRFIFHWVSQNCVLVDWIFHEVVDYLVEDLGSDVVKRVSRTCLTVCD